MDRRFEGACASALLDAPDRSGAGPAPRAPKREAEHALTPAPCQRATEEESAGGQLKRKTLKGGQLEAKYLTAPMLDVRAECN